MIWKGGGDWTWYKRDPLYCEGIGIREAAEDRRGHGHGVGVYKVYVVSQK